MMLGFVWLIRCGKFVLLLFGFGISEIGVSVILLVRLFVILVFVVLVMCNLLLLLLCGVVE